MALAGAVDVGERVGGVSVDCFDEVGGLGDPEVGQFLVNVEWSFGGPGAGCEFDEGVVGDGFAALEDGEGEGF